MQQIYSQYVSKKGRGVILPNQTRIVHSVLEGHLGQSLDQSGLGSGIGPNQVLSTNYSKDKLLGGRSAFKGQSATTTINTGTPSGLNRSSGVGKGKQLVKKSRMEIPQSLIQKGSTTVVHTTPLQTSKR